MVVWGWRAQEKGKMRGFDFPSVRPAVIAGVWMSRFFSHFLPPSLATFLKAAKEWEQWQGERLSFWVKLHGDEHCAKGHLSTTTPFCSSELPRGNTEPLHSPLSLCLSYTPFLSSITRIKLLVLKKSVPLLSVLMLSVWRSLYGAGSGLRGLQVLTWLFLSSLPLLVLRSKSLAHGVSWWWPRGGLT